jgi:hypothetical protein
MFDIQATKSCSENWLKPTGIVVCAKRAAYK